MRQLRGRRRDRGAGHRGGADFLKAPPRRLTGVDAAVPYYRNEEYYLITEQDIADAAHQLMEN